ncbi:uncharacterized protein N7477_004887 [Penicillium maclennaniae]|uniref:uncharacterized protein n=1 Tax=Penicillium maclennaniae TaxID=1343394 RepID=UPI0025422CE8|nr:uncharacterized protein N7477_004887 [Penicillium maclennaniae]KAJ5674953.1 hypothetical protein N7477_004887 [Penicillium maclennaniae]
MSNMMRTIGSYQGLGAQGSGLVFLNPGEIGVLSKHIAGRDEVRPKPIEQPACSRSSLDEHCMALWPGLTLSDMNMER